MASLKGYSPTPGPDGIGEDTAFYDVQVLIKDEYDDGELGIDHGPRGPRVPFQHPDNLEDIAITIDDDDDEPVESQSQHSKPAPVPRDTDPTGFKARSQFAKQYFSTSRQFIEGGPAATVPSVPPSQTTSSLSNDEDFTLQEEAEHQRAVAKFAAAKECFEARKAARELELQEEIEFMRLQSKERHRLALRGGHAAADTHAQPTERSRRDRSPSLGLFVSGNTPDGSPEPASVLGKRTRDDESLPSDHDDEPGADPPSARRKQCRKRKAERSLSRLEEALQMSIGSGSGSQSSRPSTKAKAPKTSKARAPRTKKSSSSSSKNGKAKGRAKPSSQQRQQQQQPDICNFGSAFTSNVFKDTARNANLGDQPTWTAKRKSEALKELIASVPNDQRKAARIEKNYLLKATQKFKGQGSVRSDGRGGWVVKGMLTSLKNHQLLGSAFMRQREIGDDVPRGGICGDGMGLGKTVTMLANMANDTTARGEERKITLIVVPAALVTQWDAEIKKHCKDGHMGSVMKYISGHKPNTNDTLRDLSRFDIIITTYNEVMASYPRAQFPIELQTAREKQAWWERYFDGNRGDLHRLRFHRVILDEAQAIKNHKSRTSLACRALEATHRWALSGTPVVNSPVELYAYFKFLRVPYTGTFNIFKENYHGDNDPDKVQRLQVMLSKFMIRRTHQDTMFGAAIIKLPKAEEKIFWVDFNEFERAVYEIVRRRMIVRINAMARRDKLERNYSNVLTMLLRLRQMCANLLLVEVVMRDILEVEDHHKIRELADIEHDKNEVRTAQISHIRKVLQTTAPDKTVDTAKLENPANEPVVDDDDDAAAAAAAATPAEDATILDHGRQHGLRFDFQKYLKTLREGKKWNELRNRTVCTSCRNPPDEPWVTSCYHLYCRDCLELLQHEWASKGATTARCMECSLEFTKAKDCAAFDLDSVLTAMSDGDDDDDGLDAETAFPGMKRWRRKKGGKKRSDDDCVRSWIDMGGAILPSAKTIAIKAQILNWLQQDPDVKIIVYTQFHAMMRILGKMCDSEGWSFLQYHGKMSRAQRDNTIVKFGAKGNPILLASLRCGGLGLNLTMASKVICVDPWWNNAVEQQAFCRVFRIGQEQETQMTRFVVRGTVDEDMIKMQNRKQAEIDKIMEDGDDGSRKALGIKELMRLFGPVDEDEEGRAFIMVEDQDTLPRFNADSEDEGDEE